MKEFIEKFYFEKSLQMTTKAWKITKHSKSYKMEDDKQQQA